MRRVVITGVGAVTPVGLDAASTWAALLEGQSGVGLVTLLEYGQVVYGGDAEAEALPPGSPEGSDSEGRSEKS